MVYAIQQLIINLNNADKTAVLNSVEHSSDDPPIGDTSSHNVPSNMTALSNYMTCLNPLT
jgi:hypothetical protein